MISVKPWKWEAVGRFALGVFAAISMGIVLNSLLAWFFPGMSDAVRRLIMAITTLVLELMLLGWIGFFLWESSLSWVEAFGFTKNKGKAVLMGIAASMVALPLAWGFQQASLTIMKWLHISPQAQAVVQELQSPDLSLIQKILFGVVAIVAAPVVEECIFRGILYPTIKQAGYPKLAMLGTALLFGIVHANALTFVPLTLLGLLLVVLYEATDNLLASIAAHSVFNGVNFLLLIFMEPLNELLNK